MECSSVSSRPMQRHHLLEVLYHSRADVRHQRSATKRYPFKKIAMNVTTNTTVAMELGNPMLSPRSARMTIPVPPRLGNKRWINSRNCVAHAEQQQRQGSLSRTMSRGISKLIFSFGGLSRCLREKPSNVRYTTYESTCMQILHSPTGTNHT